ncbi:MAG TPA: hypothetical protein VH302_05940 [Bryobacteraceae bacterium]|jgi:hypothetical protein|nr:hypothetical protein [Bryobacteraceae bacterium]
MFHEVKTAITIVFLSSATAFAQSGAQLKGAHQPMRLEQIHVAGTRLPVESILRISGLKIGQMIDDQALRQVSDKITSTGLVKGLDYEFNPAPAGQGVDLAIKVFDEGPLLPARIVPPEQAEPIWSCLQSADPIFSRDIPNTEKAIHFYSINIARCLGNEGLAHERVSATVACDGSGKSIAIDFHVHPAAAQRQAETATH